MVSRLFCSFLVGSGCCRFYLTRCGWFQSAYCSLWVVSVSLLLVVGRFRSFLVRRSSFQVAVGRFRSFQVVSCFAKYLNQVNSMLYKVRDFVNANIQYIMHYLNCKTSAQLTVSTFSRKRHLELSILQSVMLTPLFCFITLELLKLQIKSKLRTISS